MNEKNKLGNGVVCSEGNGNRPGTYDKLFWLFIAGSLAGVLMEGVFCKITKGHWESHVVSVFGSFNILYGFAAVLFFVAAKRLKSKPQTRKFVILALTATALELACGLLLKNVLGMRAWNYNGSFMNYKGIICLGFSVIWGVTGLVFCRLYPKIDSLLDRLRGKKWHIACVVMSLFMVFDFVLTGASVLRWSRRHYGKEAKSRFEEYIDRTAPDSWMQARFVEWEFLDRN